MVQNGFRIYATQPLDSDLLNPKVKYSMSHFYLLTVPTNKSKVLAYLPKQTYERLVLFQRDHGLSLSQAVTLVIEDYFGLRTEPLESVSDRLTRLGRPLPT